MHGAAYLERCESVRVFLQNTYQSAGSIQVAKREIPSVGEIWRALSQVAVHVTS